MRRTRSQTPRSDRCGQIAVQTPPLRAGRRVGGCWFPSRNLAGIDDRAIAAIADRGKDGLVDPPGNRVDRAIGEKGIHAAWVGSTEPGAQPRCRFHIGWITPPVAAWIVGIAAFGRAEDVILDRGLVANAGVVGVQAADDVVVIIPGAAIVLVGTLEFFADHQRVRSAVRDARADRDDGVAGTGPTLFGEDRRFRPNDHTIERARITGIRRVRRCRRLEIVAHEIALADGAKIRHHVIERCPAHGGAVATEEEVRHPPGRTNVRGQGAAADEPCVILILNRLLFDKGKNLEGPGRRLFRRCRPRRSKAAVGGKRVHRGTRFIFVIDPAAVLWPVHRSHVGRLGSRHRIAPLAPADAREAPERVFEVENGDADLLEVVRAFGAVGRLPHLLHGWQQEPDKHGDDGDYYQELDQRKAARPFLGTRDHWRHSDEEGLRENHYLSPEALPRKESFSSSAATSSFCNSASSPRCTPPRNPSLAQSNDCPSRRSLPRPEPGSGPDGAPRHIRCGFFDHRAATTGSCPGLRPLPLRPSDLAEDSGYTL